MSEAQHVPLEFKLLNLRDVIKEQAKYSNLTSEDQNVIYVKYLLEADKCIKESEKKCHENEYTIGQLQQMNKELSKQNAAKDDHIKKLTRKAQQNASYKQKVMDDHGTIKGLEKKVNELEEELGINKGMIEDRDKVINDQVIALHAKDQEIERLSRSNQGKNRWMMVSDKLNLLPLMDSDLEKILENQEEILRKLNEIHK